MSGHSKWATIRRSKDAADQKRGAIFSKLAKAITVAAREGGGDEETNFKLRLAISKAKQANMPKDNIKRAIESGTGGSGGNDFKEDIYEAYGPGGSAIIIETLSNNVNRTVSEIKFTLSKYNGKLAERNSALRLFEKIGVISFTPDTIATHGREMLELELIELDALDIEFNEGILSGSFPLERFSAVADALAKKNIPAETENVTRPLVGVTLSEKEHEQLTTLLEHLDDLEDVETIFTNVENL